MAQRLRALVTLSEDLGSIPSNHMVLYNCLWLQFQVIWLPYTNAHKIKFEKLFKNFRQAVVAHAFNPSTQETETDLCEFKASLVYKS